MITYNQEKYIKQAIESVLAQQTDYSFELNVFNDASTDKTHAVINEVIKTHPKGGLINYHLHKKNIGLSANYIYSIRNCHGKYVAICEGDDYWTDNNKLQKQVDFLEKNPVYYLSFHQGLKVNISTNEYIVYPQLNTESFDVTSFFDIVTIPMASAVFRNNNNIHFLPGHSQMDFNLLCSLMMQGSAFFIREVMSVYRVHESAATFNHFTATYLKTLIGNLGIEARFPQFSLAVRREIANVYVTHVLLATTHFRKELSKKEIGHYLVNSIKLKKRLRSYFPEYKKIFFAIFPALDSLTSYFNIKRMKHFLKRVFDKLTVRGYRDQLLFELKNTRTELSLIKEQHFLKHPVMVIGGVKINLPLFYSDHIQKIIYQSRNYYELETLEFLRLHYKQFDHIIDIGSNIGNHMLYYCNYLQPQKVHCFEPNAFNMDQLQKNISLNQLDNIVAVYPFALGAESGKGLQKDFTFSNTGMNRIDKIDDKEYAENTIDIRSLDELQIEHVNFVKIDVEGFEIEVLKGAGLTLKRCKPVVMVEVFDSNRQEVEDLLQNYGYRKFFTLEQYNNIYIPE